MIRDRLNELWKMKPSRDQKYYDASAPCSVLSVLLDNGVIEDPFYRDNELKLNDIFEEDYEFFRMFTITGENMRQDEIDIVFYGLDTLADIYINGNLLSSVNNMHRTYRFAIKKLVRPGANEIRIIFHSPLKALKELKQEGDPEYSKTGLGSLYGNQYIRKSHSMFGWDWGPVLPDAGIFRDIEIQSYSKARIIDVLINQQHENDSVTLTIDPILKFVDTMPVEIEVSVGNQVVNNVIRMPENGRVMTRRGENEVAITISNPKLWWPNGLGEQNLYNVHVKVGRSDNVFDERKLKIGLRTLTVSTAEDEYGKEFAFVINGKKMFAMGANYIPEDAIYPHITAAKQEELIKAAKMANFNCLRVWGGGYYPSDNFYDLCDKNGIIVWQDLMFACNAYELTEEFEENIVAEIKDNVKRIRHHACLGLWCGNNEIEAGFDSWDAYKEFPKSRKADYVKIFDYLIPRAVKQTDSETFFWASSPSSGECFDDPEDENRGDSHYWEVWHGNKSFDEYKNHYFRFCSEFGFQSFPCKKSVDMYTEPEDHNIFSRIMELHQKNGEANGRVLSHIAKNFLYPKDFESVLYISQILQGVAIKTGVQHMRRNRGRCMGALYWQLNDNYPVASWSSIDYYGRWKALHYMARRFYEPLSQSLVIEKEDENELRSKYSKPAVNVRAYVMNDSQDSIGVRVSLTLRGIDGHEIVRYDDSSHAISGKVMALTEHDFSRYIDRNGAENVYIEADFAYTNKEHRYETACFVPYKHLALQMPNIDIQISEDDEKFEITLTSDTFAPFVTVDIKGADGIFSDNVIDLTAGKERVIEIRKDAIVGETVESVAELKNRLVITCLQDTYMDKIDPGVVSVDQFEE